MNSSELLSNIGTYSVELILFSRRGECVRYFFYINTMSLVLFINNIIMDRIISMPIDLVCSFSLCNSSVKYK